MGIQSINGEEETVIMDTKIQLRFPFQFPIKFGTVSRAKFRGVPTWAMGGRGGWKFDERLERYRSWREGKPDPWGINYRDIL